jgi:hypothetical protein
MSAAAIAAIHDDIARMPMHSHPHW